MTLCRLSSVIAICSVLDHYVLSLSLSLVISGAKCLPCATGPLIVLYPPRPCRLTCVGLEIISLRAANLRAIAAVKGWNSLPFKLRDGEVCKYGSFLSARCGIAAKNLPSLIDPFKFARSRLLIVSFSGRVLFLSAVSERGTPRGNTGFECPVLSRRVTVTTANVGGNWAAVYFALIAVVSTSISGI